MLSESEKRWPDASLVLFAHGSSMDSGAGAPVYAHAAELRRRGCFAEVREAFWKQEPRLQVVVQELQTPRVFLEPLFTSEGYFSGEVIPRALRFPESNAGEMRRVLRRGNQSLFYCRPVGTSAGMVELVLDRAREVVEKFPFPRAPAARDTTLFIVGHGTEKNERSRLAVEQQVELARARGGYAAVEAVFLEEDPRISECYRMASTRNVVLVPFFVGDGPHTQEDIPLLLGESGRIVEMRRRSGQPAWRNPTERMGKLVWYAASVGTHPGIAEIILQRVQEAIDE